MPNITVSRADMTELRRLHDAAKPGEVFLFKGQQVLREYAYYLLEYLQQQFEARDPNDEEVA